MRYANRTCRAIEAVGGAEALVEAMKSQPDWTNPIRTFETWLQRKKVSPDGVLFIWRLAEQQRRRLTPDDFTIVDAERSEAA
ncbi:MAG: hypothetical protein ACR2QF_01330 [Geminicoccaceae bacterium]